MKNTFAFILMLAFILGACGGVDKEEQSKLSESELRKIFNKDMTAYLGYMNKGDYNSALDFMPSKVFKIAPKEQMVQMFEQLQEQGMRMEVNFLKLKTISKVVQHEGTNYCKFTYDGKIIVHLSGAMLQMKDLLMTSFQDQYEGGKVTDEGDQVLIEVEQTVIAISEENSSEWKYAEYNKTSEQTIQLVVPDEVLEKLL